MNWQKTKHYLLIIAVGAVVVAALIWLSHCGDRADLKAEKKSHKEAVKKIKKEKEALEATGKAQKIEIESLREQIKTDEKERNERNARIVELEKEIKNIPKRTAPFEDKKECEKEYAALESDYIKRGKLIVELNIDIGKLEKTLKTYGSLDAKYQKLLETWEKTKAKWQEEKLENKRYIEVLERKSKKKILSIVIGPSVDIKGRVSGIAVTAGVDVTGLFKLVFR